MNTPVVVEYPCGCRYRVPPHVEIVPRNCPEHWLMDKAIRIDDDERTEEPRE